MTLPFDKELFPFGKRAGDNKLGFKKCPFCSSEGYHLDPEDSPTGQEGNFFAFRNELSAKEYYISGLCQSCQDSIFTASPEDEE